MAAIHADPHTYALARYSPPTLRWAAVRFARWEDDEASGVPAKALCRRCGVLLVDPRPCQQLHDWCYPPVPARLAR